MPYFRHYDVYREADLIEEVARVHGLQRLPATLPARRRAVGGLSRTQKLRREVEDHMITRGRGNDTGGGTCGRLVRAFLTELNRPDGGS